MDTPQTFAEIVEKRIEDLQTNPFALAQASGISYDKLRSVIRKDSRRSDPKFETAREICEALDLEFYIGPRRERGTVEVAVIEGEEFATVPRFDARLAAGPGANNDTSAELGAVAFRRDWLARHRIAPAQAMVMTVQGDSMTPTLADGDLVLIDRRRTLPAGRRIYALTGPDGDERIKRIERLPDALVLHSDNPAFPTEIIQPADAARIRILGEAIWWGHLSRDRS